MFLDKTYTKVLTKFQKKINTTLQPISYSLANILLSKATNLFTITKNVASIVLITKWQS